MRRSIVVLGDIHGAAGGVARIAEQMATTPPDLVSLVGDLGSDLLWRASGEPPEKIARGQASVDRVLQALDPLGAPVALVPGNHDVRSPAPREGAVDVDGRRVQLGGFWLAGIGGAGPALFGLPYEWTEAGLAAELARLGWSRDRIDVLLCHAPPRETGLDRLLDGVAAGSEVIRTLIRELEPPLFLCGHIHESVGHRLLGRTLAINAGRLIHGRFDRVGRPRKGSPMSYQYYRVELDGRDPIRLERVRLSCKGPIRVLEHEAWAAADGFRAAQPEPAD
jgi:Icc-related predicted phosphoesterase